MEHFAFKAYPGPLGSQELRNGAGEVEGHDTGVALDEIGRSAVSDLEQGLAGFAKPGYFVVRLRFDLGEADAIRNWFGKSAGLVPPSFRIVDLGSHLIVAINVKAIYRPWPSDDVSWTDLPWEIRYSW
jgi:hypothetical protein